MNFKTIGIESTSVVFGLTHASTKSGERQPMTSTVRIFHICTLCVKPQRSALNQLLVASCRIALVEEGAAFFEAAEVVEDDRGGGRAIARVIDPIDPARHRARDQKTRDRY